MASSVHHHSSHAPNVRCRMSHLLFLQLPSPPDGWQMCLSYWIERTSLQQCYPCCYTWTATSWATAKRLAHDHRQLTAGWRSDHNGERCEHTGKMRLFLNWMASLETDHMLISVVHKVKSALNMIGYNTVLQYRHFTYAWCINLMGILQISRVIQILRHIYFKLKQNFFCT